MDQEKNKILFDLLRSAISGVPLDTECDALSLDMLQEVIQASAKHDIDHLVALAIKQNSPPPSLVSSLERVLFRAVYRYRQIKHDYDSLCAALERAQICFIPLKGSVLRSYYPEPWMRTSCDIDVLVRKNDLDKAVSYLVDNLGYKYEHTFTHDVSMFTNNGIHIELHYNLMEDEPIKSSRLVLDDPWASAKKHSGYDYWYELSDEVFYFYHIAHMAKHFENGGCGIRPFIDLNILNRMVNFDVKERRAVLEKGGLSLFADQACLLSEIWFNGAEHNDVTRDMEQFILHGGVYGIIENQIAVQQQKQGGKFKYAISKIWLPYDTIKFYYPVLGRYKIFTPIMQLKRWCRLIFCGHLKRSARKLSYSSQISKEKIYKTSRLMQSIGL